MRTKQKKAKLDRSMMQSVHDYREAMPSDAVLDHLRRYTRRDHITRCATCLHHKLGWDERSANKKQARPNLLAVA